MVHTVKCVLCVLSLCVYSHMHVKSYLTEHYGVQYANKRWVTIMTAEALRNPLFEVTK